MSIKTIKAANLAALCGDECPECTGHDIEDNGASEYRCVECDHRWGRDYEGGDWYGAEAAA